MSTETITHPTFDLTPTTDDQKAALKRLLPDYSTSSLKSYDDPDGEFLKCLVEVVGLSNGDAIEFEKLFRYSIDKIHYDIEPADLQAVRNDLYHNLIDELFENRGRIESNEKVSRLACCIEIMGRYVKECCDIINRELMQFVVKDGQPTHKDWREIYV